MKGCAYREYIIVSEEAAEDVNSDGSETEEIQAEQRGWVCRLEWGQDQKCKEMAWPTCLNMPAIPMTG